MSKNEALDTAECIVQRYKDRGMVLPKHHAPCEMDPVKQQEFQDCELLRHWAQEESSQCPVQITNYLDSEMPGWRGPLHDFYHPKAQHIVDYYNRKRNFVAPIIKGDWQSSKDEFQEYRSLCESKAHFCGEAAKNGECPPRILAYLNREAPNWLSIGQCKQYDRMDESFLKAEGIVERYVARGKKLPKEWRNHKNDPEREREYKDAQKLSKWKETLKREAEGRSGKGGHNCPPQLQAYLDSHMPGWRAEAREKNLPPMERAQAIVARYRQRGNIIPRQLVDRSHCPERHQEFKDAVRLKDWKRALRTDKGGGGGKCDEEVKIYLDTHMPGWRSRVYVKQKHGQVYGEKDDYTTAPANASEKNTREYDNIVSIKLSNNHYNNISVGCDTSTSASGDGAMHFPPHATTIHHHISNKRPLEEQSGDSNDADLKKNRCADDNKLIQTQYSTTHVLQGGQDIQNDPPPPSSISSSSTSSNIYSTHDDKEISAAAGLVAAYSPRV